MESTTHSHAESATLPCRSCGHIFESEVWVVVDVDERPDLLARLRAGTIHDLACPECGRVATVNAPLLVYRPGAEPPLLFSPAKGDDRQRDEEQAEALLGILVTDFGDDWRDEWLEHGVAGAAREALPMLLGDDPETAARLAAATRGDVPEISPSLRRALEEIINTLTAEGIRVQTPEDLGRALATRPELKARVAELLGGGE